MKSIFAVFIALTLTICVSCRNANDCEPGIPSIFSMDQMIDYEFNKTITVLELKPEIHSKISCEAYLIVFLSKRYSPLSLVEPFKNEGFKDSLKVDGFHVRAYSFFSVDYPVYIKKVSIRKGENRVSFKIVFPKNYSGIANVIGGIGILRIDEEIINRFENLPSDYELEESQKEYVENYFEAFPDSSKTSLMFTGLYMFREMTVLDRGEFLPSECYPKETPYYNFATGSISINWCYPFGYHGGLVPCD